LTASSTCLQAMPSGRKSAQSIRLTPKGYPGGPRYNQPMAVRTMNPIHEATSCAVAACAEIIGAKWTALLVHDLSEGPRRFSELEHSCAGISPRTLSERLRALEDEGVVERRSYAESPPRVEYELTEKGEALLPIIEEMRRFGHAHLTD
jgi:DNA-binding HxlR family transcriptional regulator